MKNIISNVIGFIIIAISVYSFVWMSLETVKFGLLIAIGLACFYFENQTIQKLLKKYFESKIK